MGKGGVGGGGEEGWEGCGGVSMCVWREGRNGVGEWCWARDGRLDDENVLFVDAGLFAVAGGLVSLTMVVIDSNAGW